MPAGRADPKNRSDLEGRAAPQKQVRSRRSKKEVRSGKWGCPRKTGPGPKVRCGRWEAQNGPSFPSMPNMGGTQPQIGPPKCVSHGATTQMDLFFRGRLPKRTSFSSMPNMGCLHWPFYTSRLYMARGPIISHFVIQFVAREMDARKTVDFKFLHFDRARKDDCACIQISSSVVESAQSPPRGRKWSKKSLKSKCQL